MMTSDNVAITVYLDKATTINLVVPRDVAEDLLLSADLNSWVSPLWNPWEEIVSLTISVEDSRACRVFSQSLSFAKQIPVAIVRRRFHKSVDAFLDKWITTPGTAFGPPLDKAVGASAPDVAPSTDGHDDRGNPTPVE